MLGPQESNPLLAWQRALGQARDLMGELRYAEARQVLSDTLAETRGLQGSAVDSYLPVTYGMFGECCFQLGDAAAAVDPTTAALRLCQAQGDLAGVQTYLRNLFEIHRYLGQAEPAAATAERYADTLTTADQAPQAAAWRRHAQLVRAGEPLNRVVVVVGGEQRELDDLPDVSGRRLQFVFQRNRITLAPARRRTSDGEQLGGQGRHAEAYTSLQEAARLDPFDPHPRYLSGLALLHLRRYPEAIAEYEATERLAPGWYNCRADIWLARELAGGALDHELYLTVYQLEDAPLPPQEKVAMAEAALRVAARLAPLHLFHGRNLDALGATAAAKTAYRNGLACPGDPDTRSRLLVALATATPSAPERTALLAEAAATIGGNLVAAAMAITALHAESSTSRPTPSS
jgi:tetratricopeptide (TPR) repeat protein